MANPRTKSVSLAVPGIFHGMTLTMPLSGMTCQQAETCYLKLQTRCEVSIYTHDEDIKSGIKCRNWGSLGRLEVTQGHRQCHHSIVRIGLPIQL